MAENKIIHSDRRYRVDRNKLPFRSVNRRGDPSYQTGMQRHHVLPRQLLARHCFGALFDQLGRDRIGFDDFRRNGLLLPANDTAAIRIGLPLHRGPHRDYNQMVLERVGQIELAWSSLRLRAPEIALDEARMRLDLLQRALRRRLLSGESRAFSLNRRDPGAFEELDELSETLWCSSSDIFDVSDMGRASFIESNLWTSSAT